MIKTASGLAFLSTVSQGIALLALPVIALFFGPGEFNTLAVFTAIATILLAVSALRLDMAIPIVTTDQDAWAVARLSGFLCLGLTGLVALINWVLLPLGALAPEVNAVMPWLPLAVLFGGAQAILLGLALRRKYLLASGVTRVVQTSFGIAVQISLGALAFVQFGLVIGFLANIATGAAILAILVFKDRGLVPHISAADLCRVGYEQRDYMKYSAADALLNASGLQLPLLLISLYAGDAAGGFLFMAIKLFYTPSTIISGAFAKIYHASIGEALRDAHQVQLTQDTLVHLFRFGGSFVIASMLLGPWVIERLLGPEWQPTATLLPWMAPWIFMQLLASPISTIMMAAGRQRALLTLTGAGFFIRVAAVLMAFAIDASWAIAALSLSSLLFYAICFTYFSAIIGLERRDVLKVVTRSAPSLGSTAVASVILKMALHALD